MHKIHRLEDLPYHESAPELLANFVDVCRPRLAELAGAGYRAGGRGFLMLYFNPETFARWIEAWDAGDAFGGEDIASDYVVLARVDQLTPEARDAMAPAIAAAREYRPRRQMVLFALIPNRDGDYGMGWLAVESVRPEAGGGAAHA